MSIIKSIINNIVNYKPILHEETLPSAAVLVLLISKENKSPTSLADIEIVLTKRAANLADYANHYSLPGGMKETIDENLYATVTREVAEELMISASLYQNVGQLDDFFAQDGMLVRPFVATMDSTLFKKTVRSSTAEIAEIYYLPLNKLAQFHDEPKLHPLTRRRPSFVFNEGPVYIWGLTAAILIHFYRLIS